MKTITTVALAIILISTSCVSKKKYTELQDSKTRLENEVLRLQEKQVDYEDLKEKYEGLQEDFKEKNKEYNSLSSKYDNLERAHDKLKDDYNDLLEDNKDLMKTASEEKRDLSEELVKKQEELRKKENELRQLSLQLDKKENNLNELKESLQARESRIQALQTQLNDQRKQLESVRERVTKALLGFPEEDLSVEKKDGKIYVSLSQNLLFAKGSDKIDSKGIEAIKKLATVLKDHDNLNINVEGHTDSDGSVSRNWELSTERATSVVEVLQNNGVDPERLTASGRALYVPVAPNDSKANKALNRRTEIILSPDLSELYNLVNDSEIEESKNSNE